MTTEKYITASCAISRNTVYKNGEPIFVNKGIDLPGFLLSVYQLTGTNYSRFYKMDNLSKLGWLASELLLKDFTKESYTPEDIGIILSNTNASLDTDRKYWEGAKDIPSPSVFVYTLPNIVTGEICIRNNFKGEDAFFVFDEFNAGFITDYVNSLLDKNVLQACICGWVELLGDEYKTVLYLVEKMASKGSLAFTEKNIQYLFDHKQLTE